MAGFLYFWQSPELATVPGDFLPVLEGGATCMAVNGAASPTGERGILFADGQTPGLTPERLAFREDKQTWREAGEVKGCKLMVGMWNDWVPGERDLRRRFIIEGEGVRMGDGGMWVVPRLMFPTCESCLPQSLWVDLDGATIRKAIVKEYSALGTMGVEVLEFIRSLSEHATSETMLADAMRECGLTEPRLVSFAVRGIGGNYRIGMVEAGLLGLVTTQNSMEILAALVGVSVKKNDTSEDLPDSGDVA